MTDAKYTHAQFAAVEPESPLPWSAMRAPGPLDEVYVDDARGDCILIQGGEIIAKDAGYIVTACNERPAMLTRIAELEAQVARVRELRDEWSNDAGPCNQKGQHADALARALGDTP